MLTTEEEIRDTYQRQGVELATRNNLFNKWSANSQYGYTFEWFDTKEDAERFSLDYYLARGHLINQ